jgi:hypothetical protein
VPDPASETLWSSGAAICTLQMKEGRYEVLLHRDGRFVCLLTVDSEAAARSLAHTWLITEIRRQ